MLVMILLLWALLGMLGAVLLNVELGVVVAPGDAVLAPTFEIWLLLGYRLNDFG